ncbi:glycosyltransferase family 2 protein [uncultured Roseibium sp.]|uniref:glycosyltransferase family 2 protein n=1 Tax=uncultured Roseibium sp. TaxID=1936171 RepID=UPI00261A55A8|nr:glycosyltransferase family 2 protein [uncultured Roseibium sp.]
MPEVDLSIVATMYKSEDFIPDFVRRIEASIADLGISNYEIILVDDGCPGQSLEAAKQVQANGSKIRIVQLSRNFGHHKAIITGLSYARGERVFVIDVDLEEPPESLLDFWREMDTSEADIVYGVQPARKGWFIERFSGTLFYNILDLIAGVTIPHNALIAKLMTREFTASLVEHRDRSPFLGGLVVLTGYKQVAITIKKGNKGSTTYTLKRKVVQALNSVVNFSTVPLNIISVFGFFIFIFGLSFTVYLVMQRLLGISSLPGWTSVIASLYLVGGLIILMLGILGIYVAQLFDEVRHRPYTIVQKVLEHEKDV